MFGIVRRERILPFEAGISLAQARVGLAVRCPKLLEPGVVPTDDGLHGAFSQFGEIVEAKSFGFTFHADGTVIDAFLNHQRFRTIIKPKSGTE